MWNQISFKSVVDQIASGIVVFDSDFRVAFCNQAFREQSGFTDGCLADVLGPTFGGNDLEAVRKVLESGRTVAGEIHHQDNQVEAAACRLTIVPQLAKGGEIVGFIGSCVDIADRESSDRDAEDLVRLAKNLRDAQRIAKIGIFDYSVNEDLQYWSDELIEMVAFPKEQFPAPADFFVSRIHQDDLPRFNKLFSAAVEHGVPYEITVRVRRYDGPEMYMQIIADVQDIEGDRRITGIARDVTEETTASNQLAVQEERFRIIADTVSDVLWDYSYEENSWWITPDWHARLDLQIEEGETHPAAWSNFLASADAERVRNSFKEMLTSDATDWQEEFSLVDTDGLKIDIEVRGSVLRRADGWVYRILGNARNVTFEKRQREGYTRSRALEAVGQLTGGVAHDFNNFLMIIQSNAELLEMSDLGRDEMESLAYITQATHSAAALTRRLLSFSGQTAWDTSCVDLTELIDDTILLLRSGFPESIVLDRRIAADIWSPAVDANGLEQVIVNLAMNARDALPEGGRVSISCSNHEVTDDMVPSVADLAPGKYVKISVSDDGVGMPPDVLSKAFEPYFTTKELGKGTGLGLSTAYGYAKQSGGAINLYSEQEQGTTVHVYLPASAHSALSGDTENEDEVEKLAHAEARILVVEDQPEVCDHVEKILSRYGYRVVTAKDGPSALALLEEGRQFDILFSDIIMPGGLNGQELAEAARKILPDLKVLYTSGYPAAAFEHLGLEEQADIMLLSKPYRAKQLQDAIEELCR